MDKRASLEIPMPAVQGLIEVWSVLSDSDKTAVTDLFRRWTDLWAKWRDMMAPGQEQHFVATMNIELVEQVTEFKAVYAKRLSPLTR